MQALKLKAQHDQPGPQCRACIGCTCGTLHSLVLSGSSADVALAIGMPRQTILIKYVVFWIRQPAFGSTCALRVRFKTCSRVTEQAVMYAPATLYLSSVSHRRCKYW